MLGLLMADRDDKGDELAKSLGGESSYRIADKRLAAHGVVTTPVVCALIASLCSNPAQIVLWCFTVAVVQSEKKIACVTLDILLGAFMDGVPTTEEYNRLWEMQKVTREQREAMQVSNPPVPLHRFSDNWLDSGSVWPALAG